MLAFYSPAPRPRDEDDRQATVTRLLADGVRSPGLLEEIVEEAADLLDCATSAVSIVDGDRQWFAARRGFDAAETSRAVSFCAHAILAPQDILFVPDARIDPRFAGNPLVLDGLIRFYVGVPLVSGGVPLGALCAFDAGPKPVSRVQLQRLSEFAKAAAASF